MSQAHDEGDGKNLRGVLDWVDSRFGPIRNLSCSRLRAPEPAWWLACCELARAPAGTYHTSYPAGAAGTSTEEAEALQRALGESLERYSGLNLSRSPEEFQKIPAKQSCLLQRFPICAADEPCLPTFRGLDADVPLTHVRVRRLLDGEMVWVPAAYVDLNFQPKDPEPLITLPISTGLAFHAELHHAIWTGLCEVAERDAIMMIWLNRRCPPMLSFDDNQVPFRLANRLEQIRRVGLTAYLFDMSTDFRVPAVFCILAGKRYPYFVAGASCRADPLRACAKALDEAVSVRFSARRFAPPSAGVAPSLPSLQQFDWVRSLEFHELLYAHWQETPALDFMIKAARKPEPFEEFARHEWWTAPDNMGDLAKHAARLQEMGLTVLWTDVTAPEVMEFGHVVKVVVPEMLPLAVDHNCRWLATRRLLRAADLQTGTAEAFNPYPHPFA